MGFFLEGTKEKERADRRVPRARREERCVEAVHTRRMFGREGRVGVGYERQRRKRIADFVLTFVLPYPSFLRTHAQSPLL